MRLTKPQKLIYEMEKFAGGSVSVICGSILINGNKDVPLLQKAINELYRLNDALRISVAEVDGVPVQTVSDYREHTIDTLRFSNKAELDCYGESYARKPIDLFGDLCEFKIILLPERYGVLLKLHHIIGDAWSLALLADQLNVFLNREIPEVYSYSNYLESENGYINSKRYEKDKAFFLEQFKKCSDVIYLSEKSTPTFEAERKTFIIDNSSSRMITAYAENKDTSAFVLFTAAFAAYFNRVKNNAEKFYIGTAVLNRSNYLEKNTVGVFINTVPMLIELDNDKSFSENLSGIEETAFSVLRHQKYNYGDTLAEIRKGYGFSEKLYDVVISYQNASLNTNGCKTTWYHSGMQTESLQIHIDDRDNEGVFRIHYDYLCSRFSENEIELTHQHILNLLFSAIENDGKKLYELSLLSKAEKQMILYDFNDTAVDYPKDKCIHQLFEEQVTKTPDKTAVVADDKTLAYCELNEQANNIAHSLMKKGVQTGDIVAFMLPRQSYLLSVMMGILKTGAAYLPIDPDYPYDRIEYMLSDSGAKLCITADNINEYLCSKEQNDNENIGLELSSDLACYCIYTSGSTGKPKGTLITHRNVVNYSFESKKNILNKAIHKDNRILSITTVGFDIFVTESLLPLMNGMEIVLANEEQAKLQSSLCDCAIKYKADVLQTTPTRIKSLISDQSKTDYLKQLKVILLGGEALEKSLVKELQTLTKAQIWNVYGPTETTVWVTNAPITDENDISIGKPACNTQIFIVDKYLNPVPVGVAGELCIAGDCVCAGYLNRPELNDERFIENPFGSGKLYKTGDLAYWRWDGNITYIGRNDFQVKIRGLRVELGEIENAISSIDGISDSVVIVRENDEGRQLICAFYTGVEMQAKDIRESIGNILPKYMLPHIITYLDTIPLTSSGKANRNALPDVELNQITSSTEYIPPTDDIQKILCQLMESVLQISPIGITDDFFDNGGDSLKAIELVSKAHSEGIYFNLQNIFDYPTVKALCEYIADDDKQTVSYKESDFEHLESVLSKNRIDMASQKLLKNDVGNILIAGATGYLGAHILADFLDNDEGAAYCLVRGSNRDESKRRLSEILSFYFGEKYNKCERIKVVCADLQKDMFALSDSEYQILKKDVDTVINCAASVKHYGSYKYFYEANVETVKRLILFCREANARLIHTSTLSVSGNGFTDQFDGIASDKELHFYESDLYIGQPLDNVYAHSKFEAERIVLEAMTDGLKANIMRMGNLTNRSDGVFQKNYLSNAFLKRVKAVIDLGIIPNYLLKQYAEFTPIDEAAKAVMTVTRHFNDKQTVFHINSTKVVYLDRLTEYLNQLGYSMDIVSGEVFAEKIRAAEHNPDTAYIFEALVNELNSNDELDYDSNIHIENQFTEQYLKMLGFEWQIIGLDYLRKYFAYFEKIGFIGEGNATELSSV